jgi:hypothetical protein
MASCYPLGSANELDVLPGSINCTIGSMTGCSCTNGVGYTDPSLCNASCNFLKAPVVQQLHQPDDFKKLYWNLDTGPTKGPQPDICGLGIRNCVGEYDWTGVDLK